MQSKCFVQICALLIKSAKKSSLQEANFTFGGRRLPAFSHPLESTGASSDNLIFLIPSRASSQFAGASTARKSYSMHLRV